MEADQLSVACEDLPQIGFKGKELLQSILVQVVPAQVIVQARSQQHRLANFALGRKE